MRRRRRNRINALTDVIALAQGFDVVSFDLFDTLIVRAGLSFEEIQDLAAERLMQHVNPAAFDKPETVSFYRHHTSTLLRDSISVGSREPALETIVDRMLASRAGAVGEDERRRLAGEIVEFELQLELDSLVAHPQAIEVLTALQRSGKRIIAMSDMYFSPAHMDRILEAKGLRACFDDVFVSAGIGETKHEGRAFEAVRQRLGVDADRILHVGDNPISDVDNAIAAGWSAARLVGHFPQAEECTPPSGSVELIDLASGIMASFLVAVLARARRNGIRRVFFLSRDATVMARIWQAVRAANPELAAQFRDIEVRELCVSRSSTHALSMLWSKDFMTEAVGRVAWLSGRPVSYREVVDYYDVALPATAGRAERSLPVHALAAAMERDGLAEELRRVVRERQGLTLDYLRQEGAVGGGQVIFADIGYSGTVAVYLTNYLLREAPELLARTHVDMLMVASNGFLDQNQTLARQGAAIHPAILFRQEQLPAILSDNFAWLECLFRDTARGQLRGYRREGERILPVFEPARETEDQMRSEFEQETVRKLSGGLEALGYGTPTRIDRIRARAIGAFMRPSPELVAEVGKLTQEADALGIVSHPIVETVPRSAVITRLRHWKVADYWISGCLVASGQARLIERYDLIKKGNSLVRDAMQLPKRVAGLPRRVARRVLR